MKFIAYKLYTWLKEVPMPITVIGQPTEDDIAKIKKNEDIKCISDIFEVEELGSPIATYDRAMKVAKHIKVWKEEFKRPKKKQISGREAPDFLAILPPVKSWRDMNDAL